MSFVSGETLLVRTVEPNSPRVGQWNLLSKIALVLVGVVLGILVGSVRSTRRTMRTRGSARPDAAAGAAGQARIATADSEALAARSHLEFWELLLSRGAPWVAVFLLLTQFGFALTLLLSSATDIGKGWVQIAAAIAALMGPVSGLAAIVGLQSLQSARKTFVLSARGQFLSQVQDLVGLYLKLEAEDFDTARSLLTNMMPIWKQSFRLAAENGVMTTEEETILNTMLSNLASGFSPKQGSPPLAEDEPETRS